MSKADEHTMDLRGQRAQPAPAVASSCAACGAALAPGSRFCSGCGAPVAEAASPENQMEAMLAEANLQRIRGDWDAAEARCVDVMRQDPNSAAAHSLLGDIYRDQRRLEEASQWYKLAIDLDPDNAVDRAKLDNLERTRAQRALKADAASPASPSSLTLGTQTLAGLPPVTWIRALTGLGVAFVLLVVILVAFRPRHGAGPAEPNGTLPEARTDTGLTPPPSAPTAGRGRTIAPPPSPGTATVPTDTRLPAPTQAVPPLELSARPTGQPVPYTAPAPATGQSGAAPLLSQRESDLQGTLGRPGALSGGAALVALTVDPQSQRCNMVLLQNGDINAAAPTSREEALRTATRAAQLAFSTDAQLQRVAVSVRLRNGGRAEPCFAGDIDRRAASALQTSLANPMQLQAAYSNVWWAPAPSAPAGPDTGGRPTR